MSQPSQTDRAGELREVFVAVTGDESVTERQETGSASEHEAVESTDREVDEEDISDAVADGLEDAVAGAEVSGGGDPAGT